MEPENAKEVEKSGEGVSQEILPNLNIGDNNIENETISEEIQSEEITFDHKDESPTDNKLHTEIGTQLVDTEVSEDVQVVVERASGDFSEVNTETNHNQETDSTWYSNKSPEDKAGYDDVKVQVLNCQEQKYTTESDPVNIPGETFVSTDPSRFEPESGEEREFKAAAAVITQENYENTLKCQSNDFKYDEINNSFGDEDAEASEHNTGSEVEKGKHIDLARERSLEKEDCVDSQGDQNEKTAASHVKHGKLTDDLSEERSDEEKVCVVTHIEHAKEIGENDSGNDKGIEKNAIVKLSYEETNEDKEVFSISDHDSCEILTTNETYRKLDSTHSCQDTSFARDKVQENSTISQTGDIGLLDDDESRAGDKIMEIFKKSECTKNEKNETTDRMCNVSSSNSEKSDCETTNETGKDVQGDSKIKLDKSSMQHLNVEVRNFNEELETTLSSEELFINDNQDTSVVGETRILNKEIRIKLKLNGDYKNITSPVSDAHLETPTRIEEDTISIKEVPIRKEATVVQQKHEDETIELRNSERLRTMECCDSEPHANITEDADVCDMKIDNESKLDNTMSSQLNSTGSDINNVEHEDESSHCSSLASVESNSTGTSSSHQLVIDHPMEELDAASSLQSQETGLSSISLSQTQLVVNHATEEFDTDVTLPKQETVLVSKSHMEVQDKLDQVKGLKRKLSESSEHGLSPKYKQPHLEIELHDNARIANFEKIQENSENSTANERTKVVHTPFKSLLLQRLQKPYMPPPPAPPAESAMSPTTTNSLFPQPLEQTSFIISQPIMPASISNTNENIITSTKYLCFKCKTGCFESFTALNEHQRECLADTRLLPTRIAEISSILPISLPPALATPPSSASPDVTADMTITDVALQSTISTIVPSTTTATTATVEKKRYYKCSSCNTFHENWNLFLHIRDKHHRHMCIYCIRFFPTAEKLSVHLEIKHDLEQIHFNSEEALRKSVPIVDGMLNEERFLMCCTCQHLFKESEPFSDHNCAEFMKPCTLCGQNGRHSNQCKAHPDAKRSSRTKKKSKKVTGETVKNIQPRSYSSFPLNSMPEANLKANLFNCDSNQPTATVQTDYLRPPGATLHNDDSNSSSNMVIDESCTTTHSSLINPFKELDERWRLEQQSQNRNETNLHQARDPSPSESKLTVPKFKLRVPKEFQKSVDVALSSTDSDDEDEINEDEGINVVTYRESSIYKNDNTVAGTTSELPYLQNHSTAIVTEPFYSEKEETRSVDKDECMDNTNPNLARILQEIERTKLDIQRTKETLHHTPTKKLKPGSSSEATTRSNEDGRNWTPTPPSSPKQTGCLLLQSDSKQLFAETESAQPEGQQSSPLQRKDSQGSDAMDIDETITGQPSGQPPREAMDKKSERTTIGLTAPGLNTSEDNTSFNISNSCSNTKSSSCTDQEVMDIDHHLKQKPTANVDDEKGIQIDATKDQVLLTDNKESLPHIPTDGIEVANEDVLVVDLQLDQPIEKIKVVDFVRICLKAVYPICLYCNHARRIAVNGQSLVLHMLAQHRFSATVDSITAEELKPETICAKLKTFLPILENDYFNSTSYCTTGEGIFTHHFNERIFECFQCRFVTSTHKELYLHNRKMHLKTAILCFMCRANFFSFSEILCHICPGAPNKASIFDVKFRCCLCDLDDIPSPFRLMVHLRKRHFTCDICLEDCRDQGRLSSHVWKHKLHHVCYRCGIAYRNKMDITKHLFWKHGTESIICKRCLQKRWRHVYHFCVPPVTFNCDICNLCFSKAMYLNVHKRLHNGDLRYPCTEENCEEKFVSRKLLLKHTATHMQPETAVVNALEELEKTDEDMKPFEADKQIETECSKPSEQELKKDAMDIKKEAADTATAIKSPTVKYENSESNVEAKPDKKPDMNVEVVENLDNSKEGKANCQDEKCADAPRKKKKKNKRSKESLEDLNLIAPNLSETDSSEESDLDNKSRGDESSLVPKVMLSPLSETENDLEKVKKSDIDEKDKSGTAIEKENSESGTGNVLEIWKNLLQTQQENATSVTNEKAPIKTERANAGDDHYSIQDLLKFIYADHDYCKVVRPPSPVPPAPAEKTITPSVSPVKRNKAAKSPRRVSNRRSASSSSSDSSSSSGSSCSCGSNCSCSSSGSHSSSSSSSSDDSESSVASNISRKRHRKKLDRERSRKKSESVSPLKKHLNSETVNVVDDDLVNDVTANSTTERIPSPPKEPQIYESDLETAESETDEEFYDEHPQKLASELLAQKRAQLIAQTRLSPSHNFDIVENSRPSTPSLPEDVICETRVKIKKKKRDRKSSGKANAHVTMKTKGENKSFIDEPPIPLSGIDPVPPYELNKSSPGVAESPMTQHHNISMPYSSVTMTGVEQLTPRPIAPHMPGRVSEGSSCSDLDGSLKRSKRARRPNKFYGYTSDDDNSVITMGQPLMMGMRAIKPQPPPQLTWRKEDLPTPSKSIVNQKNKGTRTPKTPNTPVSSLSGGLHHDSSAFMPTKRKRITGNTEKSSARKRISRKTTLTNKLPPIPTLKIRPSQLGLGNDSTGGGTTTDHFPTSQIYSSSKETDDDDDDDENNSSEASSDGEATGVVLEHPNSGAMASTSSLWKNSLNQSSAVHAQQLLQLTAPQPVLPTPQASVFNHKIPPALLPNPNFETLQYFKANNIRYPIRPPAGARQAREGESVYCYCRCPYDEVSEMIACDGENCLIEWFHFECVGIMVAPQGKWFCAECRPKYSEELYPTSGNV